MTVQMAMTERFDQWPEDRGGESRSGFGPAIGCPLILGVEGEWQCLGESGKVERLMRDGGSRGGSVDCWGG